MREISKFCNAWTEVLSTQPITAENTIRKMIQKNAKVERLSPFYEISLRNKFVKEYSEITFESFYKLTYNFVHNILLYEKTQSEYEEEYSRLYSEHKEKERKAKRK